MIAEATFNFRGMGLLFWQSALSGHHGLA